jgi:hypothetical protein
MKKCTVYLKVTISSDTCQDANETVFNIINASDIFDQDEIYDIELVDVIDDSFTKEGDYERYYDEDDDY